MENKEQAPLQPALNWQSSLGSVRERMKFMLDHGLNRDVHFLVGPEKKLVSAHKFVLIANSSVFERMFNSIGFDLSLGSSPDNPVVVPDISADIFKAILTNMYTDSTDHLNIDHADALLYAADKYDLRMLCKKIFGLLAKTLFPSNAVRLYQLTAKYNDKALADRCLKIIDENAERMLSSGDFLYIDLDTFCAIIERDTLNAAELTIYHSAIEWARKICEGQKQEPSAKIIRELLGRVLYLIRFPIIQPQLFTDIIVPDGYLSDPEIMAIYAFHDNQRETYGPPACKKCHISSLFPSHFKLATTSVNSSTSASYSLPSDASSYPLPFPITERRPHRSRKKNKYGMNNIGLTSQLRQIAGDPCTTMPMDMPSNLSPKTVQQLKELGEEEQVYLEKVCRLQHFIEFLQIQLRKYRRKDQSNSLMVSRIISMLSVLRFERILELKELNHFEFVLCKMMVQQQLRCLARNPFILH